MWDVMETIVEGGKVNTVKKLAKKFIVKESVIRAQRASCYCVPTCSYLCQVDNKNYKFYINSNQFVNKDYAANNKSAND